MTEEEMAEEWVKNNSYPYSNCLYIDKKLKQAFLAGLKASRQNEKVKYTLKKIIETVHNDRIDYYGERLVLIYDFANECLQEIEK